jgi:hypothetical protein
MNGQDVADGVLACELDLEVVVLGEGIGSLPIETLRLHMGAWRRSRARRVSKTATLNVLESVIHRGSHACRSAKKYK